MKIWIFAEISRRRLSQVALELISCARGLTADAQVTAVLIGHDLDDAVRESAANGATQIIVADHPLLKNYDDCRYESILTNLVRKYNPDILLGGATAIGRALLPRCAVKLHTGLTADCTDLRLDEEGNVIQIRPAFSDNILAHIRSVVKPQMATIRYKEFSEAARDEKRPVNIVRLPLKAAADGRTEVLESGELGAIDITASDIVVAAGRGIRRAEDMVLVEELADALGGCVAASRALVDAGIASSQIQVGYSGHRVKPKMYVACGISGAPQHLAGMKESGIIVAINSDASAPIFNIADIGYVGDLYEIIPQLTEAIRKNQ